MDADLKGRWLGDMDPLKTTSLSARAQEAIMQIIEGMDLAQDNKLPREELLASQLGVSRHNHSAGAEQPG